MQPYSQEGFAAIATATGAEHSLLSPETILPEQFYGAAGGTLPATGVRGLLLATLEDAILCFQKTVGSPRKRVSRANQEAEAWLFSDDTQGPFAFLNICAALDIDPHYVRAGLLQWRRRRTQRIAQPNAYPTVASQSIRIAA